MSVSLNSTNDSTRTDAMEELADLTQNHDEVLDLSLALGALGGLRHSAACEASERSTRRYDERQHRLHESRMRALGMEGDEKPEADDMSQQVLIRSPVVHNHYAAGSGQPQKPTPPSGLSNLATAALLGTALLGTGGLGAGLYALFNTGGDTVVNQLDDTQTGLGLVPPGPPRSKEGSP